ncbi:MAG: [FeFe] hydrogenase H-cluster radical SAM maturase HydE [Salinivirgaceae bacterium]|nr:[FeFe] hydrogenase H-cluster radical SAM maturase HydE [Salinivirgaceae bacterium]MDY0281331.1 [FeFe] hydrogenase H-cluster radical SAM maturase HydE [Salinivirgaceae bacterium]
MNTNDILTYEVATKSDLVRLLNLTGDEMKIFLKNAGTIKFQTIGNKVYFRGLIEFSNRCSKNCYYCGIRASNDEVERYDLTDKEILEAATFAYENRYGSLVLQGGERFDTAYIQRIDNLIKKIKQLSNNELGITLSLGEQTADTYRQWYESGAHRYLLRIETSNKELYSKIHPQDRFHDFENRVNCLYRLKDIGYQTGTGVMIGLPYQTIEHLADDLIFMKNLDIDMVGMGPFIEHHSTPFHNFEGLLPLKERFELSLKMIAVLRTMMPDINMVASTAMQAIDPMGRERALQAGANIIMPNVTPGMYRENYKLYENKPCIDENADDCIHCLEGRVGMVGHTVGYGEWGDSKHFKNRIKG